MDTTNIDKRKEVLSIINAVYTEGQQWCIKHGRGEVNKGDYWTLAGRAREACMNTFKTRQDVEYAEPIILDEMWKLIVGIGA